MEDGERVEVGGGQGRAADDHLTGRPDPAWLCRRPRAGPAAGCCALIPHGDRFAHRCHWLGGASQPDEPSGAGSVVALPAGQSYHRRPSPSRRGGPPCRAELRLPCSR
jgi:hypothetical protein